MPVKAEGGGEVRDGDWTCGKCGLNVFASKSSCFKCGWSKGGGGGGDKRVDPSDGKSYTKAEFKEQYGGYGEWDAARPAGGRGRGRGAGGPEKRMDDGKAYTKAEFLECYGGYREWDKARPAGGGRAAGGGKGGGKGFGNHQPYGGRAKVSGETIEKRKQAAKEGRRLFIQGIPWSCAWQELKDHFKDCGDVLHADVVIDGDGKSKGWGVVEFKTAAEAQVAIKKKHKSDMKAGKFSRYIEVRLDKDVK